MATRPELVAGRAFVLIEAIDRTRLVLLRAQQYMQQWANKMQAIGTITLKVSIAMALPIGYAIKELAEFESRVNRLGSLLEKPRPGFLEDMGKRIRELSVKYGVSTSDIQKGFVTMISGGMDQDKVGAEFDSVLKTAIATRTENIENIADAVRRLNKSYGLGTEQATDFLLAVDKTGGVNFEELAGSIGRAAGVAQMAGVAWEEFGAMIAGITNVLPTDEAITAINNMLTKTLPGTASDKTTKILKQWGIDLNTMVLKGRTFMELLQQMWSMPGKSEAEVRFVIHEMFPDNRGLKGITQLLMHPEQYKRALKAVKNSKGLTAKAYKPYSKDLLHNLDKNVQGLKNIALTSAKHFEPALLSASKSLQSFIGTIDSFLQRSGRLAVTILSATAGMLTFGGTLVSAGLSFRLLAFSITPIINLLWLLYSPLALVRNMFVLLLGTLSAVIPLFTAFLGLGFFKLAGVATLFWAISKSIQRNKDDINALSSAYGQWWSTSMRGYGIVGWFDQMKGKAQELGNTFQTTFMGMTDALLLGDINSAWDITTKGMELSWLQMLDILQTTWEGFAKFFTEVWQTAFSWWQETIAGIGTWAARELAGGEGASENPEVQWLLHGKGTLFGDTTPKQREDEIARIQDAIAQEEADVGKLETLMQKWASEGRVHGHMLLMAERGKRKSRLEDLRSELERVQNPEAMQAKERKEELRTEYNQNDELLGKHRADLEQATKLYTELGRKVAQAQNAGTMEKLFLPPKLAELWYNPSTVQSRALELMGLISALEARQKEIAVEVGQLDVIPDKKLPGPTAEQWEQTRQQMAKYGFGYGEGLLPDFSKAGDAFQQMLSDVSGVGAQDPEAFRRQQARRGPILKLKEELDALRKQIEARVAKQKKRLKAAKAKLGMATGGNAFSSLTNTLVPSSLRTIVGSVGRTAAGSVGRTAAGIGSDILGIAVNGIAVNRVSGEAAPAGGKAIPATQTIMKNTKEAVEWARDAWQLQNEGKTTKQTTKQEESEVRRQLLKYLPKINEFLQQLAGAEAV